MKNVIVVGTQWGDVGKGKREDGRKKREEERGRRKSEEGRGKRGEKGWNVLSDLDVWICKVVNCARHPKVDPPKVL